MSLVQGSEWMTATMAHYQTKLTSLSLNPGTWTQLVGADPRRWYFQMNPSSGGNQLLVPTPVIMQGQTSPSFAGSAPLVWKWWDCPPLVTGPWFVNSGINVTVSFIEVLYVGP